MTTSERSGSYPIDSSRTHELNRLARQSEAWAPDAEKLLDAIGVAQGWHCLDLGCGPEGLTRVLADRVGTGGSVTGLEFNPDFVRIAGLDAPGNVQIICGDAYATGLPDAAFDLVHMRFLASTSGESDRLIAEALRLVRPGRWLALQEAAGTTLTCYPPLKAWTLLTEALVSLIPDAGGSDPAAHRFFRTLLDAGMEDVGYRPCIVGTKAGDAWAEFFPATCLTLRDAMIERGLMTAEAFEEALAACKRHLAQPGTVWVSPMLVQVWGRKPEAAGS